jgi:Phosphotransferase enzyme family
MMRRLPVLVESYLKSERMTITSIEELSGVNPGREISSYRIHSTNRTFILKQCTKKREFDFYNYHDSFCKDNDIYIPELYTSGVEQGEHWILIEDIPMPFPKTRWRADSEQILQLYKLHSCSLFNDVVLKDPYPFYWNEEHVEKVKKLVDQELVGKIEELKKQTTVLYHPYCMISGDPNPTNWGIRKNGDLVLFDFERIGYGNPAIDLAITIPGFGSEDGSLEHSIAEMYLSYWKINTFPFSVDELTKQIQSAKMWIAIDYVAHNESTMNPEILSSYLSKLNKELKGNFKRFL